MECPNCKIEMKFLKNNHFMYINKKPIPFLVNEGNQRSIHMDIYGCPKCGLIQQYIPEDELEYIKKP